MRAVIGLNTEQRIAAICHPHSRRAAITLGLCRVSGKPIIPIVQDTREQDPLDFKGLPCTVEVGCVKVFDYSLAGDIFEDGSPRWAIERKSLPDFVGAISGRKEIQDREFAKVRKARHLFDKGWPLIYVVESPITGILPERACPCIHRRASARCPLCHGAATEFCPCIKDRPALKCEFCGGSGILGYNYKRRRIGSPFVFHQISVMLTQYNVSVLFADSRLVAACMIEALLRRRWEWLQLSPPAPESHRPVK